MYIGGKDYKFRFNSKKKSNIENYLYLNGRIAFKRILEKIKKNKITTIYCPNYICDSILSVIDKKYFKIKFYNVHNDFSFKITNIKNSIILIINYFGKKNIINKKILNDNIIVEDKTLSFINEKNIKIRNKKNYYFFASLRKLFSSYIFGICNLKNKNNLKNSKEFENIFHKCVASSYLKENYIKKNFYPKNQFIERIYLKDFQKLEEYFDKNDDNINIELILKYANFNNNFLNSKKKIKNNLNFLKKNLFTSSIHQITLDEALFCILKVKNKKKLINYLKKFNIFLSEYWKKPKILKKKKLSHNLYKNILILPSLINTNKSQLLYLSKKINTYLRLYEF